MRDNPWIPYAPHPKQQQFLLHTHTRELLFGGAARSGKTAAALMGAAQFLEVPGYAALILRENFADLCQPGGFVPMSKEWWTGRAHWSEKHYRWTFPGGSSLTFGYLERDDDVYQYQGSRYQYICLDELTQHTEWRYRYLFSRLDRPESGPLSVVPLRMRATANPGGKGHAWVKARFIDAHSRPAGTVFVPARVEDNLSVDRAAYVESLSYLDPVTRAQLLAGDWDAYEGGRFRREWFRRYRHGGDHLRLSPDWRVLRLSELRHRFLTVDTAASVKTAADYTVISAWGVTPANELIWLGCVRGRWEVPDIPDQITAAHKQHGAAFVAIEAVAGHSGVGIYQALRRTSLVVKAMHPKGDKLERATKAILLAEDGRIYLPEAAGWLDDAEGELVRFSGDEKKDDHDDVVDTLSMAAELLGHLETGGGVPYTRESRR